MASIESFKQSFGEGQRVSLFRVTGAFGVGGSPSAAGGGDMTEVFVKSAQFPSSNIGTMEIPFRGRKIKMPGDRTFNEWTISVSLDDEHTLYNEFVAWSDSLNSHEQVESAGIGTDLKQDWYIEALGPDGQANGNQMTLVGCWPSEVGTVDFNFETTDTVAEFSVTMQFDYWRNDRTT